MEKPAPTDHDVHDLIRRRWSPVAFSAKNVPAKHLLSVLEAARWSASCFNDQPWSFLVGRKPDETWQGIYDGLMEANQAWAETAPVLMISLAHEDFVRNGKPNRHAQYDVGQSVAAMAIQATALDLFVHQMAGFDAEAARTRFKIPDRQTPMAAIAIGYGADPAAVPEALAARQDAPRQRVPVNTFTFAGAWGEPADIS